MMKIMTLLALSASADSSRLGLFRVGPALEKETFRFLEEFGQTSRRTETKFMYRELVGDMHWSMSMSMSMSMPYYPPVWTDVPHDGSDSSADIIHATPLSAPTSIPTSSDSFAVKPTVPIAPGFPSTESTLAPSAAPLTSNPTSSGQTAVVIGEDSSRSSKSNKGGRVAGFAILGVAGAAFVALFAARKVRPGQRDQFTYANSGNDMVSIAIE